ncbi:MAG: sodium:alanine symporter family protein [Tannerellaceae bacterium]|jgi:AGCS family alanine or glycine:cation symporter|nr:sodium:alanine symporter family protein [Tannerellaceae bacterium]
MQKLNDALTLVDSYFGGSQWFVFLLLGTGLFYTIYLKFPQIRFFRHAIRVLSGKYDSDKHVGDTSHFQALSTALSGTIGTGNIAGVALAIHLGGPPAIFWMLMTAFVGMTTKLVEVTLSHKYREQAQDGSISGGPMYYMKNRLNMRWLAALFALATIFSSFGTGSLPQINSISNAVFASFGISHYITGAALAALMALIIIGGIKRIARVSEKLVPFMSIVYVLGALSVLIYNHQNIVPSIIAIFGNVFNGTAATGGFLGATVAFAFNRGVNRGLFSNEAGQGSAPIAHAAARTEEPVSEGMVSLLEPFIDTIIICFFTGLTILSSGAWMEKHDNQFQQADLIVLDGVYDEQNPSDNGKVSDHILKKHSLPLFTGKLSIREGRPVTGNATLLHARSFADNVVVWEGGNLFDGDLPVENGRIAVASMTEKISISGKSLLHSAPLSTEAFKKGLLGEWGKYVIPLSLLLFAFTTSVAWSYYGDRAVTYLWGSKYVRYYHIIYVVTFFLASFTDTTVIWTLSGITIALMTLPNLFGILLLHKEVKSLVFGYWKKIKQKDA